MHNAKPDAKAAGGPPCVAAPQVTFKKVKALEALGLGLREGLGFGGLEFRV